jgi:hypothetical protein
MTEPDKRNLEADLDGASFLSGVANAWWGRLEQPATEWPIVLFWVAAAARTGAPDRFHLRLDCANYPTESPQGTFCDPATGEQLAAAQWPKGTGQVEAVFKSGWENGQALYHPLDRLSMQKHPEWPAKYPGYVWKGDRNVTRYLTMVHRLLNSSEYTGV